MSSFGFPPVSTAGLTVNGLGAGTNSFGMPAFTGKASKTSAGSGDVASQMQQQSQNQSSAGQYFFNPALVGEVGASAGGLASRMAGGYENLVNNPTATPTYQNSLVGMLAALHPSEMNARRNLADQFRSAGNLASSSYAKGAAGLESGLMRNRMEMASDLLAKLYPAMTQAAYAPIGQASNLINAEKMNQQQSTGSSTGSSTSYFDPLREQLKAGGGGGGSVQFFNQGAQFSDLFGNPNANPVNTAYRVQSGNVY